MPSVALDDFAFSRAKALIARELPSKEQEARFRLTKTLTLVGFALVLIWIGVLMIYDPAQRFVLFPAAVSFLAAEGLFLSNISFLWRLGQSWRTARRLGYSSRLRPVKTRARAADRLILAALLALVALGVVLVVVTGIGLFDEVVKRQWLRAGIAFGAFVFAWMCVLLAPMAWVRDRVHAVWALHAELESAATAAREDTPVEIPEATYHVLSQIERTQIETDREVAASGRRQSTAKTGLHLKASFFQALTRLNADEIEHVNRALDAIVIDKHQRPADAEESAPIEHLPIPSTNLSIEFRRRSGRRVDVLGVRSANEPRGHDA
jgi:hypothetical protein